MPFYLLLFIVCAAPLPFGAVQVGAWSLLVLSAGFLLAVWGGMVALGKAPAITGTRPLRWAAVAFVLAMAWIVIQTASWTPAAWHHPVWTMGADGLGVPLAGRISLDPQAGILGLTRLLAYAAIFWLAVQYGRDAGRATRGLTIFAVSGAAASGLALLIWGVGLEAFLWFDRDFIEAQTQRGARLAIPFVNPNHLASFAGIGLICAVGLLIGETRGLWRPETESREKLRRFIENVVVTRWYLIAAVLVYVAVLLLSRSRGGLLAALLGVACLVVAVLWRQRPTISAAMVATVAVLGVGAVVFAPSAGRMADRVAGTEMGMDQRLTIYRNTIDAVAASPWLGYGHGGFPSLYRMYDEDDVTQVVEAAHSTVLETVAELGIPAALVLFTAMLIPVGLCWRGVVRRRRDQHLPAIAAAMSVAVIIHSMVDFPLQIPALATAFSFIMGLGVAQSTSSKSR
ncbi:O-antigen ligase family protein [Iodidimonas sp. SYSU 1G8]|uniref:O-antigen ligase family protein n=1 Tax=Iodidimonas sp. SYSU 1G8 TaxID=3133967 RepID=UPI0031FEEF8E